MNKVAVVILNWNGQKLLEQFLPTLLKHTTIPDVEIVVADNCSSDNSIFFVKNNFPQIKLLSLSENYGYAEGYNKALAEIEAEYVVLLNSDVEVTANWLQPMISFLDNNRDVAALQPKLLAQRNKDYFEYAGAGGGFIDKYGHPFCRGRILHHIEKDSGQYDCTVDIFWATGACLMIRRNDFFEVGALDGSFFAHMEEIDLCWRLNARGKRVVCLPSSVVYHVGAATLAVESPRKTFLNFRNNLLMLYKNLPEDKLKSTLRIRVGLDYLAILKFVLSFKFSNAKAIYLARKEFHQIKNNYKSVREENLRKQTQTIDTIYSKSIIWAVYIKRIKLFSQLKFR